MSSFALQRFSKPASRVTRVGCKEMEVKMDVYYIYLTRPFERRAAQAFITSTGSHLSMN